MQLNQGVLAPPACPPAAFVSASGRPGKCSPPCTLALKVAGSP